ncbi:hypothetical protein OE88DRAFT_1805256 [Heliocybe sulcata]|uniref:Chromo domain-containing protein n=1 Tax=Heliocybe sulcata TaxID=5364 RepID=A0A5C3NEC9_9AGAM|nr:hypothetical protein OE88DRAFT_1805256 [Heliocybe sulcata]
MSDDEQDCYEVGTVIQAKVVRKTKRKVDWEYYVAWKGYGPEENTWEPPESFNGGSEHFLAQFWERVNLGGRDINDAKSFKEGETLFPVGPPRGRKKESPRKPDSPTKTDKQTSASPPKKRVVLDSEDDFEPASDEEPEITGSKRKRGRAPPPLERRQSTRPKRPRVLVDASLSVSPRQVSASPRERVTRRSTGGLTKSTTPYVELPVTPRTPRKASVSPVKSTPRARQRRQRSPSEVPPSVSADEVELPSATPLEEHTDMDADGITDPDAPSDGNATVVEEPPATASPIAESSAQASLSESPLPAHRERAANPLVRFAEDPTVGQDLNGGISTKARLSGKLTLRDPPATTKKPVNGRSREVVGAVKSSAKGVPARKGSLLTAAKGKLQTLKGRYFSPPASDNVPAPQDELSEPSIGRASVGPDDVLDFSLDAEEGSGDTPAPITPPTGEELLEAAGLVMEEAVALPDYEDVDMPAEQPVTLPNGDTVLAQSAPRPPPAKSWLSATWGQTTIFGPLGFSTNTSFTVATNGASSDDSTPDRPFLLSLNPEVAIPITLKDIYVGSSLEQHSLDAVIAKCQSKGPPGKLYKDPPISSVLSTGGSSARVVLDSTANDKQKEAFSKFYDLLDGQTLFLAMAADAMLAFFSSESRALAEKLGVHDSLVGLGNTILASHVSIQDYTAFVELALEAENIKL